MIYGIKKSLSLLGYRIKIRNALYGITDEQLKINLEEVRKEIDRRNKKK